MIYAPGKVLFLGGYAVLKRFPALSLAVVDKDGKGMGAEAWEGEERIISPYFAIDCTPSWQCKAEERLVAFSYLYAKKYLEEKGVFIPHTVKVYYNEMFGRKGEKSGLGSSAACAVSVVAALLEAHGLFNARLINKIAQFAHAEALGKVGSGFDVATAAEGTLLYTRFSPSFLSSFSVNARWDWSLIKFPFPYHLYVFNISSSYTDTRDAVKKAKLDVSLLAEQSRWEHCALHALAVGDEKGARVFVRRARAVQRALSPLIEPPELTALIDAVEEKVEGVVAGRCPGAGGYDSVAFVCKRAIDPREVLELSDLELSYIDCKVAQEGVVKR